jgi:uncharacterized protein with HEPN domain
MQRDPRVYLWDALKAADAIAEFTYGKSRQNFEESLLLRSAVERQFQIIGEALHQLARIAPEMAAQLPDLPRIVAFRNVLVHGYAVVDNETVWQAVQDHLPVLRQSLRHLLGES